MQTITTKILPATGTQPTRVKTTSSGGTYNMTRSLYSLEELYDVTGSEAAQRCAAKLAVQSLNWTGRWFAGAVDNSGVSTIWVCADPHRVSNFNHSEALG